MYKIPYLDYYIDKKMNIYNINKEKIDDDYIIINDHKFTNKWLYYSVLFRLDKYQFKNIDVLKYIDFVEKINKIKLQNTINNHIVVVYKPIMDENNMYYIIGYPHLRYSLNDNSIVTKTHVYRLGKYNTKFYPDIKINGVKYKIHRLVALACVVNDDPINKQYINHKDGNKSNYEHTNLEWVTIQENNIHAVRNELVKGTKIYVRSRFNNEIMSFNSVKDFLRYLNININERSVYRYINDPRLLYAKRYEISTDPNNTFLIDFRRNFKNVRYVFKIYNNNKIINACFGICDFIQEYKLWNTKGIDNLVKIFKVKYPLLKLEVVTKKNTLNKKVTTKKEYSVFLNNELIHTGSLRALSRKFNVDRSTIKSRVNTEKLLHNKYKIISQL